MINDETQEVVCDKCLRSTALNETAAEVLGWLVDTQVQRRKHFCPVCAAPAA